jgi:Ca-activated chloride channel family protein
VQAVRALSREGTIEGAHASFQLNQVYAATEHYVLMEVAFDPAAGAAAEEQEVGVVRIAYTAPESGERQTLEAPIRARFGASEADVAANTDKTVIVSVIEQSARERAARAVSLRDQGRLEEARALLSQNTSEIDAYVASNPSVWLADMAKQYNGMLMMLAKPSQWNEQRKMMRQLDSGGAAFLGGSRY